METKEHGKYFRATSDLGFRKIFGAEANEPLRIQLLNSIITDRTVVSARLLEAIHVVNAQSRSEFDLYCEFNDGQRAIVEMQKWSRGRFMDRALAYSAMAILDKAKRKWNYDYGKVYFIGILDYVHFPGRAQALTRVSLQTEGDHLVTNDNYLQIFVELPKLAAKGKAVGGEGFLRALRDVGRSDDRQEDYQASELDSLYEAAKFSHLNKDEIKAYESEMSTKEDFQEWHEHEMQLAKEKTREEAKRETARKMLDNGIKPEVIMDCTGLTEEDLKAL